MDVNLRCRENNLAHRTKEIDRERLIVRRGQPFSITVQCSETLPPNHHLDLVLHIGKYSLTEETVGGMIDGFRMLVPRKLFNNCRYTVLIQKDFINFDTYDLNAEVQ